MGEKKQLSLVEGFFEKMAASMTEEQKKEWDNFIIERENLEANKFAQNRFEHCGLGLDYWNCSFDNFRTESLDQKKLKDYGLNFCRFIKSGIVKNLVLLGDCGIGKTHIAAAILREFAGYVKNYIYEQPVFYTIKYVTVSDISDELHDAESFNNNKSKTKILESFRDYDILVIDEIGRLINKYESESDLLFRIIDLRYQTGKSTILITNLSKEDFKGLLNKATISRLTAFQRFMYLESHNIPDQRQITA